MQRVVECPVCYLTFDSKTRVPKTLACGHGFCSPCLGTVLRGSTIKCPKCRTKCDVPNGKIEKLPTSFATLDTFDATCEECLGQARSAQCNHCKLYLCNSCLQTHPDEPQSNLRGDLTSLKYQLRQLNEKVTNDDAVAQINTHGEATISQVNKTYAERIEQLKQQELDHVNKIRAQITKDCEAYLQWKQKFNKNYAEINDFLDCASSKVTLKQVTTVESEELVTQCREKSTQLDCLQTTEPRKARISFLASRKLHRNSDSFNCGTLVMEIPAMAAVASSRSDQLGPSPDYKAASCKKMIPIGGYGPGRGNFNWPHGITTCPVTGNVIVADKENHRIEILNNSLQFVSMLGCEGDGDGQFDQPFDVAVSNNGKIFITDSNNHRIQVTDFTGRFLYKFGNSGSCVGQFNDPTGLAFDKNGLLYICDSENYRIQVVRQDGQNVRCIGNEGTGPGEFNSSPRFIAVSNTDKLIVSDWDGNLHILTTEGQHIGTIEANKPPQNISAEGVAVDEHNNIIIANGGIRCHRGSCIVVLSLSTGDVITTIDTSGEYPGQPQSLTGITITANSDIIVCDCGNERVLLFNVPKL